MVRWPRNEKQTSIDLETSNVTIGFDLGHDLDLEFSRSNAELAISQPKVVRLPRRKQKANISIWTLGLKCDNGFDLGHDIDIWIFKVICDLDHLVTKVRCKDLPDSDRGDFRCRRAVDSSSFSRSRNAPLLSSSAVEPPSCSNRRSVGRWLRETSRTRLVRRFHSITLPSVVLDNDIAVLLSAVFEMTTNSRCRYNHSSYWIFLLDIFHSCSYWNHTALIF